MVPFYPALSAFLSHESKSVENKGWEMSHGLRSPNDRHDCCLRSACCPPFHAPPLSTADAVLVLGGGGMAPGRYSPTWEDTRQDLAPTGPLIWAFLLRA